MKLFLVDKYKINIYSLPNKIEESYTINYTSPSGVEETFTLLAENEKWIISNAIDIVVSKNSVEITKEPLDSNAIYQLKFNDLNEVITMYCYETPISYYEFDIGNKTEISFGRDTTNDVIYDNPYISDKQFKIYRCNNYWVLEDNGFEDSLVFVNNYRVKKTILNLGDIIFTNGLKIIWMNFFIKVNNPNNLLKTNLQQHKSFDQLGKNNEYTPVSETEKSINLYNDNQAFFHTPRLKSNINEKIIKIVKPPEPFKDDGPPAILTLGATVMMGISSSITGVISIFNVASGRSNLATAISEIFICIAMIAGTLLFPVLLSRFQRSRIKKKEKKRQERYSKYLDDKKKEIQDEMSKEIKILYQNNMSVAECQKNLIEKNNKVWSREISDDDFLSLRVGIGNQKSKIEIKAELEEFSLEDDNLKTEVENIANNELILNNVPITASLIDNKVLPLIINYDYQYRQYYINNLLLQLVTLYSGVDLKIVIFTSENNAKNWEDFKYLPHCSNKDKSVLFFASNDDEMKQISSYLEREFQKRVESSQRGNANRETTQNDNPVINEKAAYKNFDEYYLLITDNYIDAKRYGIIEKIINSQINYGFSMFMIEPTMQNIPSKANKFIQVSAAGGILLDKELTDNSQINFTPEFLNVSLPYYLKIIANIPISTVEMSNSLPQSLTFLEMYKVGKIEQLGILNRWEKNDPTISLHTPLGVHENGKPLEIDLHEKFHGPHGLIAGSTGSGKSEFIITFILSMAINYHPYEVQFVLIDYKGGGLAGAFENRETGIKIPHLAGTITNLDTAEMNRTLVSIKSELKRRQRMFNEARDKLGESTVDIYKYQKFYREGKVSEPISHLFIISDEFAELKQQQPDFMEELVSTARIGRSLGVHLILATQKPAGVVDDQIWSNAKFKICLRVQSTEDSNELLKRPEAAYIKETGRFYFQVGYNEIFEIGQSGWAGAKYIPTEKLTKTIDDSIVIIDNNGNIIQRINDVVKSDIKENLGDQLTNIVKTLYNTAVKENIKFNQLWLPSIPKEIFLANIVKKYNYKTQPFLINPIIGEYDDPSKQFQGLLSVDLTNNGNLIIYGNPGTGKENLITTVIYSMCINHSTEELNIYILDFGAEVLKQFSNMPQVGDIALVEDKDKVKSLFAMLERELSKRKELFSQYDGSYTSYVKNSPKKLPLIVTVLNGYENFAENFSEFDDYLAHLLRECSKYGIIFIMSAIATSSVRTRLSQSFNNKLALQLSDDFDYKFILNAPSGLTPAKYFGRGIVSLDDTAYEFQTAYIYQKEKINDIIKETAEKLCQNYKKARNIPIIPNNVTADTLSPYIDTINTVPIGVNIHDASICKYDFNKNKINQIIGNNAVIEAKFIIDLIKVLSSVPNIKLKVIDFVDCITDSTGLDYSNGEFTNTIKNIINNEREAKGKYVYIILGIGYIYDKVLDEGIETLFKIFNNITKYQNSNFIFVDNYSSYKRIMKENWYNTVVNINEGIWVGNNVEVQNCIKFNSISKSDINEEFNGICYVSSNNSYQVIKGVGTTSENEGGSY